MMKRRLRLRDFFARRAAPPETGAGAPSYENDELIRMVCDGDEPDVEDVARTCGRSQARLWDRIEDEFLREEGQK